MKKTFFLVSLIFFINFSLLAQKEKQHTVKTEIAQTVVYLNGAEITRSININLAKGRNKIIFKNLSPKIWSKSIRVSTDEEVSILAISSKINYLTKKSEKPRIKELKDSLELIKINITALNDESKALTIEKDVLLENMALSGQNNGVLVSEIQKAADFYRTRLKDIHTQLSKIDRKLTELTQTLTSLKYELNELNASINYKRNEVTLLVASEMAKNTKIDLKYVVYDAGWAPSYDLKAIDVSKPISLTYRAKVFNNTDIDWNEVKLILSTGDPELTATQPTLKPWYLSYVSSSTISNNQGYTQNAYYNEMAQPETVAQSMDYGVGPGGEGTGTDPAEYQAVDVLALIAEFSIEEPYTIPSDDKPYLVDVSEHELEATYKHFAVPKLDRDAFLLARITGWEELNLVDGPAHIYFGGSYIGESYIQTRNASDTLDLSLGRDKKVLVTRTKLKDYSSTKFIGSKRKETLAYSMTIKNNRKSPITIDILDQIPISSNSEIEVESIEISDADYNEQTGELKWHYKVDSGNTKTINLTFSVKYPKTSNVKVNLKQSRSMQMRKF